MKFLLIILCFTLSLSHATSQEKQDFDYTIESAPFGKERKFYVHVHEDYYLNEVDSFGVVYVLDAQANSFYNNAKSIIDYLVWSYQIKPMIVVGIHSDNRYKEFIPLDRSMAPDSSKNVGEADELREHIESEVFPIIKRDFRVNEFRAIIGHSRAGAFIANTIFSDDRDMFNAYIAISPGMHYLNNQILDDATSMVSKNIPFNKFYYCSYGTVGSLEAYFKPQVEFLDSLFSKNPQAQIEWRKNEIPNKTHWGVVAPSIADGLIEMNRAYQVDQYLVEKFASHENESIPKQVGDYMNQQQKKLKYTFDLDATRLKRYGDEFSEVENYQRALELYNLSLRLDQDGIRTYLAKASVLRELKDKVGAQKVYDNALKRVELNHMMIDKEEIKKYKERIKRRIENMNKE